MTTLNVNGRNMSVEAANDTPLLWVIREQLQMTGTKFGCGAGLCGACTVHLDGFAVRSCQTAAKDAAGKKSGSDQTGDRRPHGRQSLSLHDLRPYPARDRPRRCRYALQVGSLSHDPHQSQRFAVGPQSAEFPDRL